MMKIRKLIEKGVTVPNPESVEIGSEVDMDRISGRQVILHTGTKIYGKETLILDGAVIGREGPVTVEDCRIGSGVQLNGGYFSKAVFLEKSSAGSGAHVRGGTILEEEASIAHTVGLKQTILFPYVTLGSLINFCDCFMAGGTSRKDHSEVGSSYIHFNYTPNQDKATASLMGDVPGGVMLNQRPIFLGGQGGLVGPCRIAFGTVIAAGSVWRKDQERPGRLVMDGGGRRGNMPFVSGVYQGIRRTVLNNLTYIGNLTALMAWYRHGRRLFVSEHFPEALLLGLTETLRTGITERLKRLGQVAERMPESIEKYQAVAGESASAVLIDQKNQLHNRWPNLEAFLTERLASVPNVQEQDRFLNILEREIARRGKEYLPVMKGLDSQDAVIGTRWLQSVVDGTVAGAMEILSLFAPKPTASKPMKKGRENG